MRMDPADHAEEFAHRWADQLDTYCAIRMEELGIPFDQIGAAEPNLGKPWRAFDPEEREGGHVSSGITVNSGCLNPGLLARGGGSRTWARARLRDRIDAIIAHEYEEGRLGTHEAALKAAPGTKLPITNEARRICRAMAR